LIDVLADVCRAAGVQINLGVQAQAADLKGDIIIGADGIRSTTRNFLNDDQGWIGTNQVAWRAVVEGVEPDNVARIWMAPQRHVVTYPLPNGRVNIVAVCERKDQPEEGWHHEDDPNNLRSTFVDCADQVRSLLDKVETTHLWGLNLHKVAQCWSDGRICLLGDAAHPTLPFLAQGANLAVEDAYVMAAVCDRDTDVAVGLQRYETLRRPRVTRAIVWIGCMGMMSLKTDRMALFARDAVKCAHPPAQLGVEIDPDRHVIRRLVAATDLGFYPAIIQQVSALI